MTKWSVDGSVADRPEGVLQNEREKLRIGNGYYDKTIAYFKRKRWEVPIAFVYSSRFWQFCDLRFGLTIGQRFVRGNAC